MKSRKKRSNFFALGEQFLLIPANLLTHPVWIELYPAARVIFIDICKRHNGSNNGAIGYGAAAGAKAANVSPATANRRLNELRESGLLKLRKEGAFNIKDHKNQTREWEIPIYPVVGRRPSTNWLLSERRIKVEHWLLKSAAYIALSNSAKCILFELMRRYDGKNNGCISFGGKDGRYLGFGRDRTERALSELENAGFIVETAQEEPRDGVPRKWRLTGYGANGEKATKDFMRTPRLAPKKSFHGVTGADDKALNASLVRTSTSWRSPAPIPATVETGNVVNPLLENRPVFDIRTGDPDFDLTIGIRYEPMYLGALFRFAEISLNWDSNGVISGEIDVADDFTLLRMTIVSGEVIDARYGTDAPSGIFGCRGDACMFTGHWDLAAPVPTPEPKTGVMLVLSLGILWWFRRNSHSNEGLKTTPHGCS